MFGNYIEYVVSKMDSPRCNEYLNKEYLKGKGIYNETFNIKNLNTLMSSESFRNNFNTFAEIQTIIHNNKLRTEQFKFLKGVIIYRPVEELPNYIFKCFNNEENGIVIFNELYSKRCKKIIGHIILEGRFNLLIHHLEERVLINM